MSTGNARNIEAIAFGSKVFTDRHGFRIPEDWPTANQTPTRKALLILGDSVAFGPGLNEEQTSSGMLRVQFPDMEIFNSSVMGYATRDYRNLVNFFPLAEHGIDHVFLLFCLNDISNESAAEIEQSIDASRHVERADRRFTTAQSWVAILKRYPLFSVMNEYLRSNSKLYLLLKGILSDPQQRYWEADYRLYLNANHLRFLSSLKAIADIATTLREAGIAFAVIIAPYEFQLRKPDAAMLLPQRKLQDYFVHHSVFCIDSTPWFIKQRVESNAFFLPYDPMHFSERGHEIIQNIIVDRIVGLSKP
ncbi:MAG: SGNH/GDSL hydrolase family protein [Methylococcales bacterium]